eukprot:3308944-Pleurochrysis_carterae.AAC.7
MWRRRRATRASKVVMNPRREISGKEPRCYQSRLVKARRNVTRAKTTTGGRPAERRHGVARAHSSRRPCMPKQAYRGYQTRIQKQSAME